MPSQSTAERVLYFLGRPLVRCFYRVTARGLENLPTGVVLLFPEGELERRGTLLRLQRGYEVIARHAKAQVVPVWLDQLWGSIFSFQGGKFFKKFPKRIRYPVTVAFGEPLDAT